MRKINQITYSEIVQLKDVPLTELLLSLISNEARRYKFSGVEDLNVPLRINVGDGGDDARVRCGNTNGSPYIRDNFSIFQIKATDLTPSKLYAEFFKIDTQATEEVLTADGKKEKEAVPRQLELKEQIKEVLDAGGQYIFFIGHDYNSRTKKSRLDKAYLALSDYNLLHGTKYQSTQVRILEANDIAIWTNEFIQSVTFVQAEIGIQRIQGLNTLQEVQDYLDFSVIPFHLNSHLDKHVIQIKNTISQDKGVLRVIGHSGLGKTRLVYEAMKIADAIREAVYYNIVSDADSIIQFVRTYGKSMHGILIIDNCDYFHHKLLKDEISRNGGLFKLITIDYDVSEEFDISKTSREEYIFLSNTNTEDIVKKILNDQFKDILIKDQIEQITTYSEGYPGMAVLFAKTISQGIANFSESLSDDRIKQLAFGREAKNHDNSKFEILQACSIFSSFGRPKNDSLSLLTPAEIALYDKQLNFIAGKICITPKNRRQFLEATDYFEDRRVLERRGVFLSAKPTPLAVKLAMSWWKYTNPQELKEMFLELESLQLAIPLVNRLSELDQLREAKNIVNDLWGANSPFGKAEVLNTDLGSRLFRSVVPVNPECTLAALELEFGKLDIDQLKNTIGPGRRNLIWSLEALVFRKELFQRAVALLFRFAAAENENISNNATGQLLNLFHIGLAGTQADLTQRINAIDKHLKDIDPRVNHLAVLAMTRGLKGSGFGRIIGAEKQGISAPLKDFIPSWPQIATYWSELLDRLVHIASANDTDITIVKEAIAQSIRSLFRENLGYLLKVVIVKILKVDDSYWEEAVDNLNTALKYEAINEDEFRLIEEIKLLLEPKSLESKIRHFVSTPEWDLDYNQDDIYLDKGDENAKQFAEKLFEDNVEITNILPFVLSGEQRKGFVFGYRLGQIINEPNLAYIMLEELKKIPIEEQNIVVPAGYISSLEKLDRSKVIDYIILDNELLKYLVYIISVQDSDISEINKLFALLQSEAIESIQFYQLSNGRTFDSLNPSEVLSILTLLSQHNKAESVAFDIAAQYVRRQEETWLLFKSFFKELILRNNFLIVRPSHNFYYSWESISIKLLKEDNEVKLKKTLLKQIIEVAQEYGLHSPNHHAKGILEYIIGIDFKLFLSVIGPALLDDRTYLSLKYLLGSKNGVYGEQGLLDGANIKLLINWTKKNLPKAACRLAYMMPLTAGNDTSNWHPLAIKMIDEFGDVDGFLREVEANFGSYGSVGSRVPYLRNLLKLISKLLEHPIVNVSEWAKDTVTKLEFAIERNKLDDQSERIWY